MTEEAWPFDRKKPKKQKVVLLEDDKALFVYVRSRANGFIHYTHLERFLFIATGKEIIVSSSGAKGLVEVRNEVPNIDELIKDFELKLWPPDIDYYGMVPYGVSYTGGIC